jgi:glycerol kinase
MRAQSGRGRAAGIPQIYPAPGLVEHDPERSGRACRDRADGDGEGGLAGEDIAGIGITNQRETTIVWDRATGKPCTMRLSGRTAAPPMLRRCKAQKHEPMVSARTGLLLDPYFSATKIAWMLDHVAGARRRRPAARFGTVEHFLLWRLTDGRVHATDATNAARTLLLDIRDGALGCASLRPVRRAHGRAAAGARLRRRLRHDLAGAVSADRSASWAWRATSRRRR